MSTPLYKNNDGYDYNRKPCGCIVGVSVCGSCDLDRTLPDRWRRWVHNPAWDKATHGIEFGDAIRKMKIKEAKLKVQPWVINADGVWEPYGEPVWPSIDKPCPHSIDETDVCCGPCNSTQLMEARDAALYQTQMCRMLDRCPAQRPSLWQRFVNCLRNLFSL